MNNNLLNILFDPLGVSLVPTLCQLLELLVLCLFSHIINKKIALFFDNINKAIMTGTQQLKPLAL